MYGKTHFPVSGTITRFMAPDVDTQAPPGLNPSHVFAMRPGRRGMSLSDQAIAHLRALIANGRLSPGSRIPPEPQLAGELGISRNLAREAVKALVAANVLEIRRGDGTYVTSLEPRLLLEGVGGAVALMRGDSLLELTETRRLLEPAATGLAATRITAEGLAAVKGHLAAMRDARDDIELLTARDAAFHRAVLEATGNQTLITLLEGISSRTLRGRVWRGLVDARAAARTLSEHEAIYDALAAGDAGLAEATALVHVSTTERWLHDHLRPEGPEEEA
jgi:GntR family transcriptional repressor for pyruvate dehydrogenase complex